MSKGSSSGHVFFCRFEGMPIFLKYKNIGCFLIFQMSSKFKIYQKEKKTRKICSSERYSSWTFDTAK